MENRELTLKVCGEENVEEILCLQNEVIANLENKDILRKNSKEMFLSCVKKPNLTLALYAGSEMVAVSIFVDARGTDEDLAIGLEKHEVDVSGNYKLIMVKNEYRGGIQKMLFNYLAYYAKSLGFTHLCTTVSPDNEYSLNNILDLGFTKDHEAIKYGGSKRVVCVLSLDQYQEDKTIDYSLVDKYIKQPKEAWVLLFI